MGAGYGLVSPGVFRAPYMLQRSLSGGAQDPLAALIGNALGTYQSDREKDVSDALAAKKEQDATNWRNFTGKLAAYKEGLTTEQPVPADTPTGFTPSSGGPMQPMGTGSGALTMGPDAALRPPTVATANQPPAPLLTDPTGQAWYKSLQAPPDKYTFIHEPGGPIFRGSERTGNVTDTGAALPAVPKPSGYHIEKNTISGEATWVKDNPTLPGPNVVPVGLNLGGEAAKPVRPTPIQGQQAEFGAGALAAWQNVERERTQTPGVEEEVGRIAASPAFVHAVPGFRSSADMVQLLQKAGASDAAQRYMRAKWSFLDNIIRTRIPGGRMSGALFNQIQNEFMPSLDPAANAQLRTNELQAVLTAQGESGYDTNPQVWNSAAKRHGVNTIDLQAALAGQPSDSRITAIRGRYK